MAKELKNIYQKLANMRLDFAKQGIEKGGVNTHSEFKYFELKDILPIANNIIIEKYNCIFIVDFANDVATGTLLDLDNPEERIVISKPTQHIQEPGKFRQNEIQADGGLITYYRRYLYLCLFDIIEPDMMDSDEAVEKPKKQKTTPKPSVSKEERQAIAEELTGANDLADEVQIKALKSALKTWKEKDEENASKMIKELAAKTDSFKTLTKENCVNLIKALGKKIKELDK